jgi:tetratricopeptide (TPR) repeat protein
VRPTRAEDLVERDDDFDPVALDPAEELRIGSSVAPLAETLASEELPLADLALQRLAKADSPSALARLKNALASGDRHIRVRARGLIVRLEDGLVRLIRTNADPIQRGWAFRRLAMLSVDPATASKHLEGAAQAYREALSHQPGSPAGLELGRVLLLLGRPEEARSAFSGHLARSAEDARGYLGRAEANLAMRDLRGVRMDLAILASLDPSLTKVAARWLG